MPHNSPCLTKRKYLNTRLSNFKPCFQVCSTPIFSCMPWPRIILVDNRQSLLQDFYRLLLPKLLHIFNFHIISYQIIKSPLIIIWLLLLTPPTSTLRIHRQIKLSSMVVSIRYLSFLLFQPTKTLSCAAVQIFYGGSLA